MYLRLTLKNIEPGRGNTPLLKRGSKGLVIDDASPCNIDERGGWLHLSNLLSSNHMVGGL
jgi:hypothetical protein